MASLCVMCLYIRVLYYGCYCKLLLNNQFLSITERVELLECVVKYC